MKYVIGVDLGTSAVKILLVNKNGDVCDEVSKNYPLIQLKSGYSEQDPEEWVDKTIQGLSVLMKRFTGNPVDIEGISFSGQMHGLVLLDQNLDVLRDAILWNDTRTTKQCRAIEDAIGQEKLLQITKNPVLEGFTLPKIIWVKEHEPEIFSKASVFLLPKDYVRFRLTGEIHSEYSDAAGTLLLDVSKKAWSEEICQLVGVDYSLCPPLIASHQLVGHLLPNVAERTGLAKSVQVFAGGADNACGAIGSGILSEGKTMVSIGTSGVVLSYEQKSDQDFAGKVHYFNHGDEQAFYTMGVTLSAGYSLSWFKKVFAPDIDFEQLLADVDQVPIGANGLVFTPYLSGERTPYADSTIRGSFIGIDASHQRKDFVRAVLEGITFSLNESIEIFRANQKKIETVVSIGGGAKNDAWLQMQADIFNVTIVKLASEQGPGMGAAILAAYGCGWYPSLQECADAFVEIVASYPPIKENSDQYKSLFSIYQQVYTNTKSLNEQLQAFRK